MFWFFKTKEKKIIKEEEIIIVEKEEILLEKKYYDIILRKQKEAVDKWKYILNESKSYDIVYIEFNNKELGWYANKENFIFKYWITYDKNNANNIEEYLIEKLNKEEKQKEELKKIEILKKNIEDYKEKINKLSWIEEDKDIKKVFEISSEILRQWKIINEAIEKIKVLKKEFYNLNK